MSREKLIGHDGTEYCSYFVLMSQINLNSHLRYF